MYKYKSFYEIYDHQLLKTRALKREKPKVVGFFFYSLKAIQTRVFTWALLGSKQTQRPGFTRV